MEKRALSDVYLHRDPKLFTNNYPNIALFFSLDFCLSAFFSRITPGWAKFSNREHLEINEQAKYRPALSITQTTGSKHGMEAINKLHLHHVSKKWLHYCILNNSVQNELILTILVCRIPDIWHKKLQICPPHLKNVTALPCEMQTFSIWLKSDMHYQAKCVNNNVNSVTCNKLFSYPK